MHYEFNKSSFIVPTQFALAEYAAVVGNALFHLLTIYDLRNIELVIGAQAADLCVEIDQRFQDEYRFDETKRPLLTLKRSKPSI
jgi:hypothetical protein